MSKFPATDGETFRAKFPQSHILQLKILRLSEEVCECLSKSEPIECQVKEWDRLASILELLAEQRAIWNEWAT